jgi:hypothetical protein
MDPVWCTRLPKPSTGPSAKPVHGPMRLDRLQYVRAFFSYLSLFDFIYLKVLSYDLDTHY